MSQRRAVALLSAGLDSSASVALARREGWEISLALTFDYGQRARFREVEKARAFAASESIPHRVIELPWFKEFDCGGALLAPGRPLPRPQLTDLLGGEFTRSSAKVVWVPNRNGVFLEIGASFAENLRAEAVLVGFNREEAATFPDNTEAYQRALTHALSFSTSNGVRVLSPTASLTKREIVGRLSKFRYDLLWSCYEAGEKMCGRCESCVRLQRALRENAIHEEGLFADPIL